MTGSDFKLGQIVYHERIYNGQEAMMVIGIRFEELELEGDYSGGTNPVLQKCWMGLDGVLNEKPIKEQNNG